MNDKLTKVQEYINSLWSKNLNANDFKDELRTYLKENTDWYKTSLYVRNNNLYIKLFTDEENGYNFTVKMSRKWMI